MEPPRSTKPENEQSVYNFGVADFMNTESIYLGPTMVKAYAVVFSIFIASPTIITNIKLDPDVPVKNTIFTLLPNDDRQVVEIGAVVKPGQYLVYIAPQEADPESIKGAIFELSSKHSSSQSLYQLVSAFMGRFGISQSRELGYDVERPDPTAFAEPVTEDIHSKLLDIYELPPFQKTPEYTAILDSIADIKGSAFIETIKGTVESGMSAILSRNEALVQRNSELEDLLQSATENIGILRNKVSSNSSQSFAESDLVSRIAALESELSEARGTVETSEDNITSRYAIREMELIEKERNLRENFVQMESEHRLTLMSHDEQSETVRSKVSLLIEQNHNLQSQLSHLNRIYKENIGSRAPNKQPEQPEQPEPFQESVIDTPVPEMPNVSESNTLIDVDDSSETIMHQTQEPVNSSAEDRILIESLRASVVDLTVKLQNKIEAMRVQGKSLLTHNDNLAKIAQLEKKIAHEIICTTCPGLKSKLGSLRNEYDTIYALLQDRENYIETYIGV